MRTSLPLIAILLLMLVVLGVTLEESLPKMSGQIIYTLDDPYIHMAVARHFVESGVWGVTPYEFSSSVSSIIWPFLLAALYWLLGPSEIFPFWLNLGAALVLLVSIHVISRRNAIPGWLQLVILSLVLLLTPLVTLIFVGMEHVLQALTNIWFFYFSAESLSQDREGKDRYFLLALVLSPLVTMTRYEGVFAVLAVFLAFIATKRFGCAFSLAVVASIPIAFYGIISISNGWGFLPNPLVVKTDHDFWTTEGILRLFSGGLGKLSAAEHIRFLLVLTLAILAFRIFGRGLTWRHKQCIMPALFSLVTSLHMLFADIGWGWRYEAYLVTLGLFAVGFGLHDDLTFLMSRSKPVIIAAGCAIVLFICVVSPLPLLNRAKDSFHYAPLSMVNIFEQQYQMGLFVKSFYQGEGVCLNDVGAVNYLADIRCVDLYALANRETYDAKRKGLFNADFISEFSRRKRVRIAILYGERWGLPSSWLKVGSWSIKNNVDCGDTVTFYAVEPSENESLHNHLKEFSLRLPATVTTTLD